MTSIASKIINIPDVHEPACEQTATSRSEVTESTRTTTSAVIEIVPSIDPTLDTETEENVAELNTGTQPRSVVTGTDDTHTTGGTGKIQQTLNNESLRITPSLRK